MGADIIVSYDGTPNDDDALTLGQALAASGATLALAYVRHSREFDQHREELAEHDAQRRLSAGLAALGDPGVATHVVFSAATDQGLEQLAAEQGARLIVFGSDYRTAPGRAEPGNTAQRLLEGAPVAIAVAQAGLRMRPGPSIGSVGRAAPGAPGAGGSGGSGGSGGLGSASEVARELANRLGATYVSDGAPADLIVVASSPEGRPGRVSLSGATRALLNSARGSVVVLPAGMSRLL
jgi:nucleotide-binding universal stress UspA family protein